ncbi:tRNA (adenosine(37)-N6)-threonylcarbamoyltransferase complex ATPase subunit type 1 TsaE [Candidatus Berkelbacteria bacterium]|nr:tRNA (adenosine(37)-N6)-threonylcarbamoyltransferase complex ATPase subunit type 1 TsaE [Candidatus Berkelbacteria bacterium]
MAKKRVYQSRSERATFLLGQALAKGLKGGEIFGLIGDLGSGKTVFVTGLAAGLGIKETIQSPTFILMKCYEDKKRLCHFDFYRIKEPKEALSVGGQDEWSKKDTISVVEWADRVFTLLPHRTKIITFEYVGENKRKISFEN